MMDAFKELEEKSREQDKVQDQLRMKELRKLRKAEDKRENDLWNFKGPVHAKLPATTHCSNVATSTSPCTIAATSTI